MTDWFGRTKKILITGGAGFIGCNLGARLLEDKDVRVCVFDNLSRSGIVHNLNWLRSLADEDRFTFMEGDVRDDVAMHRAASDADEIYHLAAQVAVTSSVEDPRYDFEVNALGTLNVLEGARKSGRRPLLFFTSTNKVYGSLHHLPVCVRGKRYEVKDQDFTGVSEREQLDFHSPYGCSKGAAEQYVRDYSRVYGLPTVVFRMSCIAGPRQFGTEDQGWVAHFLYSVLEGKRITIFGDGCQVRDVLHVDDLVDAISLVRMHRRRAAGEVYNVGGGPERSVSVLEMLEQISRDTRLTPSIDYSIVRPGDQPLYVSDTGKLREHTGWAPRRSWRQTLIAIREFWESERHMLAEHRNSSLATPMVSEVVA
jgi:CDP-paratose 2-epimerase